MTCHAALAEGALAVGVPAGGVVKGYAIGFSLNAKNEDDARKGAIDACKGTTGSNAAAMAQCAVVTTFHNQCASSAIDPANGTPGTGWGVGDTQKAADDRLSNDAEKRQEPTAAAFQGLGSPLRRHDKIIRCVADEAAR